MRVISLHKNEFDHQCAKLAKEIVLSSWRPEAIVGVAKGGVYVLNSMLQSGEFNNIQTEVVNCRRQTSDVKDRIQLSVILSYLPNWINNMLRLIEHYIRGVLIWIRGHEKRTVIESSNLSEIVKQCKNILIVDDAIDSGSTLKAIYDHIIFINPKVEVKTAVIVQTWRNPLVQPDYFLYKGVLVRFPWSADKENE